MMYCISCACFCCHFYFGGVICLYITDSAPSFVCVCVCVCFLHVHVAHGQCLPSNEGVLGSGGSRGRRERCAPR